MDKAASKADAAVLVTGAGGPLGVNLTRSLRRYSSDLRIVGTDANRWHLPLSLADTTYRIPFARAGDDYRRALREIIERENIAAILPTHPVEVRAVAELRDAGALGAVGTALPHTDILAITDDKAATQRLLEDAGVPVPRTRLLDSAADLERAFAEFVGGDESDNGDEPVWIRGTGAPGLGIGGAALPCREIGVARAWIDYHHGWGKMAASKYLPGANLSWMAAFNRGALIAAGCRERLEYVLPHVSPSGITGAPAVSRTLRRDDVSDIGERAVRAVDATPHGVYFADLKEDAAGVPRVTEINGGRCGTTIESYSEAGCNFPGLLCRMAMGEDVAPLPDPHAAVEPDVYWVRTLDCGPVVVRGDGGFDGFPSAGFAPDSSS